MELMAAIRGLEAVEMHSEVVVYTDSQLRVQGNYRMDSKLEIEGMEDGIRKTR